ncbi:hypothetical protein BKA67DRAFT_538175 [Truncatella angustata]|uniref:Uncharacterized protein n=1 Tax=Truncatella angustata TaxID=152316 RepID=A0A9P8UHA9_9PEZI|nr:uncharacterized protein BKA67DRAFT_538175 [Truncatella angustata]KAH6652357.1 hypothetical protein BKA67DRAFT_538175 [Truncatella angustata]
MKTSHFFFKRWFMFLTGLELLEIATWTGKNAAGWYANTRTGFLHFEKYIGQYFLKHVVHMKSSKLKAGLKTPFGSWVIPSTRTPPLQPHQMRDLQHLEFREMFISPDLADLITGRSPQWKASRFTTVMWTPIEKRR